MRLTREQASQGRPVRIRGTITFADGEWKNGFLQSGTEAIYFTLDQPDVRSGHYVGLTGETSPGGFATQIVNARVEVLHTTNLPPALRVNLRELAAGTLDATG